MAKKKSVNQSQVVVPTFDSIQSLKQWDRANPGKLSPTQMADEKRKLNEMQDKR